MSSTKEQLMKYDRYAVWWSNAVLFSAVSTIILLIIHYFYFALAGGIICFISCVGLWVVSRKIFYTRREHKARYAHLIYENKKKKKKKKKKKSKYNYIK